MVALARDPASMDTPESAPLVAIGLIPQALHQEVRRALAGLHVQLDLAATADLVVARLESDCPDLLLIDTDLVGCPADLCAFAHSLRPDVKVFGLVNQWSEREESLRSCADAVLHKPPRSAEWRPVLRRFGVHEASIGGREGPAAAS
jgi:DNA-binding response OmpR family regulator